MRVSELIKQLTKCDQDAEVKINCSLIATCVVERLEDPLFSVCDTMTQSPMVGTVSLYLK